MKLHLLFQYIKPYLSKKLLLILTLEVFLVGCVDSVDDQRIITSSQSEVVNPAPLERDFVKNNKAHKVIIAIVDSGIDYNHPYLANNIHFDLDESGQPTGAGWDSLGEDSWPAPYIARTDYFNSNLSDYIISQSLELHDSAKSLLDEFPSLKKIFPLERNIEAEMYSSFFHGTHVAGLASYDSPEIGLRGYRVLPLNRPGLEEKKDQITLIKKMSESFLDSLYKAVEDGANVINLSLGFEFNNDKYVDLMILFKDFRQRLIEIVEDNPDIIFVAAAGNNGKWINESSTLLIPCLIPRKNVICVSAMSEEMVPSSFTNVVLDENVRTIFAWGDDILSTVPTNSCYSSKLNFSSIKKGQIAREQINKLAKAECSDNQYLQKMSGTSMATPLVARKVAKLIAAYPEASSEEVIEKLFDQAVSSKIGRLPVFKLPVEIPSWYQTQNKLEVGTDIKLKESVDNEMDRK